MSAVNGVLRLNGLEIPTGYRGGVYRLLIQTGTNHPIRFKQEQGFTQCEPSWESLPGDVFGPAGESIAGFGAEAGNTFYYGNWQVTFPSTSICEYKDLSILCRNHGYMGGEITKS